MVPWFQDYGSITVIAQRREHGRHYGWWLSFWIGYNKPEVGNGVRHLTQQEAAPRTDDVHLTEKLTRGCLCLELGQYCSNVLL